MGFPSPARDYLEKPLDIANHLVTDPDSTFFYEVDTDVLLNAFVPIGALLVVVRSQAPTNGSMVIARFGGKDYLRILVFNDYRRWLFPANKKYTAIEILPQMAVQIIGVVTYVVNPAQKNWSDVCVG